MVGGAGLEFRVLGPVEVASGGRVLALGGPKQRAVLADLILNAGSVVPAARLIDDLWGDRPPPSAGHTLETYVARLRAVLRDGLGPGLLLTRPPGYLLKAERGKVDAFRFERLVREGTASASRGDYEEASALLRAGLELWRGEALADIAEAPFAEVAARRLADQRLVAVERRIDSDLALDRARDLIAELEALIAAHPYHEPFHRQLMLALYRAGRQGEALGAFRRARGLLVDQLGIEPGPALRAMEQAILRQDPDLEHAPASSPGIRHPDPSEAEVPSPVQLAAPRWRRRRGRVVIATGLVAAVVAAAGVELAARETAVASAVPANGIGMLSEPGTAVTAGLEMPSPLAGLAAGGGSVWAASPEGHAVYRIDPATRAITQVIPVGAGAGAVAYHGGYVWVANTLDGTVSRIDARVGQVVQTIGAGSEPADLAAGLGAVWVTDQLGSAVYRIDPSSGQLTRTIGLASAPYGIAAGAGSLWVTSPAAGTVTRIDPVAGQPVQTIPVGADPSAIAYGFGSVWVANRLDSTVSRIDPGTGAVTETIPVGDGPAALAVASAGVWVADATAGTVARIDPATGSVVSTLHVGEPAVAATVIRGVPWIGTGAGYPSRHRGGTLRVLSSAWPGTFDPATSTDFALPGQFGSGTYDTLVTFQHAGGGGGVQLVPDLALAIPSPQAGGTQYTFVLRPGLRYSNGAPVRPQDFRYGLERVFDLNPYARSLFAGFAGAAACRSGSPCDLSRAITVDDHARTVTFHLTAPDGDLLYKLALPFTAPVPAGVPAHPVGTSPVPGTGPYQITRYAPGREIDLARNPYFRQWSAAAQPGGFPDRIVWRFGLTPAQEVAAIAAGRADWMVDPPPDVAGLVARFDRQVHINPVPGIAYAAFNVTVPPFNDLRVRQAVSLAADRNQAVAALGGPGAAQPTCQVIPLGLPGYRPYCPFTVDPSASGTWTGPDLARARRLVAASHTAGMRVVVWAHQWDGPLGPYFVGVLRELGYRASLRIATVAAFARNVNDSRRRVQASVGTWVTDYPSASDFFDLFFRCSSFRPADPADTRSGSFFCRPAIDRLMSQADQLQGTNPQAAGRIWAKVDREITFLAPWVPFASLRFADFTSARVGDYQNQAGGILLDRLWIR